MRERRDATDQLLDAKAAADVTWNEVADAVGRDPVWTAAVVLGQASADRDEASAIVDALDADPSFTDVLTEAPMKGDSDPTVPSDPMLYRLYEAPHVYGEAIKRVVHEEFGDGIMSAIDFEVSVERVEDPDGDRVRITYEGKFLPFRKW